MLRLPLLANPKYFTAFSFYLLLIGVLGSLIVECIRFAAAPEPSAWSPYRWTFGFGALFIGLIWYFDQDLRKLMRPEMLTLSLGHGNAPHAQALILLVSRGEGASSARWAIEYHAPTLKALWLVHSTDPESVHQEAELRKLAADRYPHVAIGPEFIMTHVHSVRIAKAAIDTLIGAAQRAGFADEDIVCDMTGMTKSVSAGMLLAFAQTGGRLTVMEPTRFLDSGRPDPAGPSIPVEIARRETGEEE